MLSVQGLWPARALKTPVRAIAVGISVINLVYIFIYPVLGRSRFRGVAAQGQMVRRTLKLLPATLEGSQIAPGKGGI